MQDLQYLSAPVPVDGINTDTESTEFDAAYSPCMQNAYVELGRVRKRRGYSALGSNLPLTGTGQRLINYIDARGNRHHIALTTSKAYEYNASTNAWDDITPVAGDFTGSAYHRWSYTLATDVAMFTNNGGTALIISNGVDDLFCYEGHTSDKFKALVHTFPGFGNCREIAAFWNHFFLINYNNGSQNVRTLAFSGFGDINDWVGVTAGGTTLTDTRGELLRAAFLSGSMVLYSEDSITACRYYGGTTIFEFPTLIFNVGLLAAGALWDSSVVHAFLGTDNRVYGYYGETSLLPIGEHIEKALFADLAIEYKTGIVIYADPLLSKIHFAIPTSSDFYAKSSYTYNYRMSNLSWEYHKFAHSIRDMCIFEPSPGLYCDDVAIADLYCDNLDIYCDDPYGQASARLGIFISNDGYVFQLDEATGKDHTSDIEFKVDSPDFRSVADNEENICRWQWCSVKLKASVASTCAVYYSTSSGASWTQLTDSPITLTSSWTTYRLPLDIASRRIRFRVYQSSSGDVQMSGAWKAGFVVQGERD